VNSQKKGAVHFFEGKSLARKLRREKAARNVSQYGEWMLQRDMTASMPGEARLAGTRSA